MGGCRRCVVRCRRCRKRSPRCLRMAKSNRLPRCMKMRRRGRWCSMRSWSWSWFAGDSRSSIVRSKIHQMICVCAAASRSLNGVSLAWRRRLGQLLKIPSPVVRAFFLRSCAICRIPCAANCGRARFRVTMPSCEGLAQLEKAAATHPALWAEVATGLSGSLRSDASGQLATALQSKDAETVTVVEGALRGIVLDMKANEDDALKRCACCAQKASRGSRSHRCKVRRGCSRSGAAATADESPRKQPRRRSPKR